ncbi:MAG: T2 family ribonuclease [Alphaproteobacteria bacterium]|nr:T2 family ribonuclease [Alphaproteobacteria bacterium]
MSLFGASPVLADKAPICDGFGFFLMSQVWPPSECKREPDHNNCGTLDTVDRWIIHGLWPDYVTPGKYPSFCTATPYSAEAVASITPQLKQKWPNLIFVPESDRASKDVVITDVMLWQHEWEKHGTCALLCDDVITSQDVYFQHSLDLFSRFDIGGMLDKADIAPDDSRTISEYEIIDAIKPHTGAIPDIACYVDKENNMSYLLEIRICVAPGGQDVIDCPATGIEEFACPARFVYPATL